MLCLFRNAADTTPNVTLNMARLVDSCTEFLPRFVDRGVEGCIRAAFCGA